MPGLRMICKLYGGMRVSDGKRTVEYVWDYENDCPVTSDELKKRALEMKKAKKASANRPSDAIQESLKLDILDK